MLRNSKIVLALALVLGTASAATAATKHRVHHVSPAAYGAFGLAPAAQGSGYKVEHGRVDSVQGESGAVLIQDRDLAQHSGEAPEKIW